MAAMLNALVLFGHGLSAQVAGFEALGETMGNLVRISGHPEKLGCPDVACRLNFGI